jgi:hypothetical protein
MGVESCQIYVTVFRELQMSGLENLELILVGVTLAPEILVISSLEGTSYTL